MPSAVINAVSGDNTIVVAQSGFAIRVLLFSLSWSAAANVQWFSGASPTTPLTGIFYGAANSQVENGEVAPAARGLFQTKSGQALNLNSTTAGPVGGFVVYEVVSQ